MLTVSFVNEIQFIAKHFNVPVSVDLKLGQSEPLNLALDNDVLSIKFFGELIWEEKVVGVGSNFGVESCDTIYRIMQMVAAGDNTWKEKYPHIFVDSVVRS